MADIENDEKEKKNWTLWVLLVLTAVYLGVLIWLSVNTDTCPYRMIKGWTLSTLLDDFIGCRTLNELGDYLAGAFAPLAFVWLVGAVLIQSRELNTQMQELRDTRTVMELQAAEMKASTAQMRAQTKVLQSQLAAQEAAAADKEFDEHLRHYLKTMRPDAQLIITSASPPGLKHAERSIVLLNVRGDEDEIHIFEQLKETSRKMVDMLSAAAANDPITQLTLDMYPRDLDQTTMYFLTQLGLLEPRLSSEYKAKFHNLGVGQARQAFGDTVGAWKTWDDKHNGPAA